MMKPGGFEDTLEIGVYSFLSFDCWKSWRKTNPWFGFTSAPKEISDRCSKFGINSSWFGFISPENVSCATTNYRESLNGNGFNPRQRAVLETLVVITEELSRDVRVYAAEGITPFARELEKRFPNFVGSEYAPTASDQAKVAPVEHQDLACLTYNDSSFDICVTNEVFEHLPDLQSSLAELHRVLAPGGILLSTFPFLQNRQESLVKAQLGNEGEIIHLMQPEYHGNPVDPKGGSLVFQVPGWDIVEMTKAVGFKDVQMILLSSAKAGLTSKDYAGVFLLYASS